MKKPSDLPNLNLYCNGGKERRKIKTEDEKEIKMMGERRGRRKRRENEKEK